MAPCPHHWIRTKRQYSSLVKCKTPTKTYVSDLNNTSWPGNLHEHGYSWEESRLWCGLSRIHFRRQFPRWCGQVLHLLWSIVMKGESLEEKAFQIIGYLFGDWRIWILIGFLRNWWGVVWRHLALSYSQMFVDRDVCSWWRSSKLICRGTACNFQQPTV